MLPCTYACHQPDHQVSRRAFLGSAALGTAGLFGLGGFASPAAARQLSSAQKRVCVIFLSGGVSQLETWDPKPKTDTGGPFKAIPTSVVGTHICELLPHTAKQMHRMALIRGLNSGDDEHGRGTVIMLTGRRPEPGIQYPELGAVVAKLSGSEHNALPGHINILPTGGGSGFNKQDAAFLGPKFASVQIANGKPPADLFKPKELTDNADAQREALRRKLNARFAATRKTAQTEAYTESYDQAEQFIHKSDVFAIQKEDPKIADRYGRHDFGRHLLQARRLLEAGVTYVKVSHTNYDTHHENFDFHIEQLGEFDGPFAYFLDDLAERGMLESTLVIVMSEMGRTPHINDRYGRDHWSKAWSVALAGAGIKGGSLAGKTNANGTAVTDREVNGGHLFHTYLQAVGFDSTKDFKPDDRPVPIADPKASAIREVLS